MTAAAALRMPPITVSGSVTTATLHSGSMTEEGEQGSATAHKWVSGSDAVSCSLSETIAVSGRSSTIPSSSDTVVLYSDSVLSRTITREGASSQSSYSQATQVAMAIGSTAAAASAFSAADPSTANLLVLVASIDCEGNAKEQLRLSAMAMAWFKSSSAVMSSCLNCVVVGSVLLAHFLSAVVVSRLKFGITVGDEAFWTRGCVWVRFPNLSIQLAVVLLPSTLLGSLAGAVLDGELVGGAVVAALCFAVCGAFEGILRLYLLSQLRTENYTNKATQLFAQQRALCSGRELLLLPSVYWEPFWLASCFGSLYNRLASLRFARLGVSTSDLWLAMLTVLLRVTAIYSRVACVACSGLLVVLYLACAVLHLYHCFYRSPVLRYAPPLNYSMLALIVVMQLLRQLTVASGLQLLQSFVLLLAIVLSWYLFFRERVLRRMEKESRTSMHEVVCKSSLVDVPPLLDDGCYQSSLLREDSFSGDVGLIKPQTTPTSSVLQDFCDENEASSVRRETTVSEGSSALSIDDDFLFDALLARSRREGSAALLDGEDVTDGILSEILTRRPAEA